MSFKAGEIVVIKTTGERAAVLSSISLPHQPADTVTVRRPVATKDNGLIHVDNVFYAFELETTEEQLTREFAEAKRVDDLRNQLMTETKATAQAQNKVPLIN